LLLSVQGRFLQENAMPNRGELAGVKRRPLAVAAAASPADAWPVIGFCALGLMMSVGAALSRLLLG
jgi:hypothetical protein